MYSSFLSSGMDRIADLVVLFNLPGDEIVPPVYKADVLVTAWEERASMFYLRNYIYEHATPRPYYMFADDDFEFRRDSPEFYEECMNYLDKNRNVGFLSCVGFFGSVYQGDRIHISPAKIWEVGRGLIFRRHAGPFPPGAVDLEGGLEDLVACYWHIENEMLPAKRFMCPTKHIVTPKLKRDTGDSFIHRWDIWESNAIKFIRDRYRDPEWEFPRERSNKRRLPKPLSNFMKGVLA
jgi:hypothetical protein